MKTTINIKNGFTYEAMGRIATFLKNDITLYQLYKFLEYVEINAYSENLTIDKESIHCEGYNMITELNYSQSFYFSDFAEEVIEIDENGNIMYEHKKNIVIQ